MSEISHYFWSSDAFLSVFVCTFDVFLPILSPFNLQVYSFHQVYCSWNATQKPEWRNQSIQAKWTDQIRKWNWLPTVKSENICFSIDLFLGFELRLFNRRHIHVEICSANCKGISSKVMTSWGVIPCLVWSVIRAFTKDDQRKGLSSIFVREMASQNDQKNLCSTDWNFHHIIFQ